MAAYEYCNVYLYIVQLQMFFNLDFAYVAELTTRISMVLSAQGPAFMEDVDKIFNSENIDFYSLGFRYGIMLKQMFDIKFD